jgi:DNA primase
MSLEDLKLRIKDIPISSVIGSYLSIKRSGSSLLSLCPFHNDSKPSMNINDNKKIYKCFACGASGDAISFVMKHRNVDFIEAMKEICEKQGINFESYQEEKKSNPKFDMAKKILTRAALIYRKTAASGQFPAYTNFIKHRGLSEDIATTYSLGYAPNKNSLSDYLGTIPNEKDRTYALSIAFELGLIRKDRQDPNAHYDTFRERIIFPIWDQIGQVIGFTSRATRDDQKAKYMNSVDSFVFNKRNILYGFHLAKSAIREKDAVILVEGNMDQIAMYNYGFTNAVAIMGTAFGAPSMDRIISLTKNVYLALDSDTAGFLAMERANKMLAEKGVIAKFLVFSPQKDPDDYLKANGALALQEKIENAIPAFDVLLQKTIPDKLPEVLDRKLEILNKAFEILSPLKNDLSATERMVAFAKRIGLKSDATQIMNNYQDYLNKHAEKAKLPAARKAVVETHESEIDLNELAGDMPTHADSPEENAFELNSSPENYLSKMEKLLVQEVVQLPSLLYVEKVNELLDLLTNDEVKKYIGKIRKITMEVDDGEYESVVLNLTNSPEYSIDLREAVSGAFYNFKPRDVDTRTKQKIIHDLKVKIKTEQLKQQKDELKKLQQTCDSDEMMTSLLNQLLEIEKNIQILKKTKPNLS